MRATRQREANTECEDDRVCLAPAGSGRLRFASPNSLSTRLKLKVNEAESAVARWQERILSGTFRTRWMNLNHRLARAPRDQIADLICSPCRYLPTRALMYFGFALPNGMVALDRLWSSSQY
jgi:hypothetical protein